MHMTFESFKFNKINLKYNLHNILYDILIRSTNIVVLFHRMFIQIAYILKLFLICYMPRRMTGLIVIVNHQKPVLAKGLGFESWHKNLRYACNQELSALVVATNRSPRCAADHTRT